MTIPNDMQPRPVVSDGAERRIAEARSQHAGGDHHGHSCLLLDGSVTCETCDLIREVDRLRGASEDGRMDRAIETVQQRAESAHLKAENDQLRVLIEKDRYDRLAHAAEVAKLTAENTRLRGLLDRDHTGLSIALGQIRDDINGRRWLLASRGPYAWDDDRYREEAGFGMRKCLKIAEDALKASGKIVNEAFHPTKETP